VRAERFSAPLWAVLVATWIAGGAMLVAAAASFSMSGHTTAALLGGATLLAAALVAEAYPVPLEGLDAGRVSLGLVFGTAAIVLFGWAAGVLVLGLSPIVHVLERRSPIRIAYNVAAFSLAAAAGAGAASLVGGEDAGTLALRVALAFAVQFGVNVALVTTAVALSSGRSPREVLARNLRKLAVPGALMASAVLTLVVLWERSPALSLALVGPLLTIALYERSTHRAMQALRLALTDPLTGLGNHRHFHERLQRELLAAQDRRTPLSLCLLDVDDFKRVNDRFGHPTGDQVLAEIAARLRHGGEAFRLGGDEFALLLTRYDEDAAREAAAAIVERIRARPVVDGVYVTISAGVASLAPDALERDELIRLADSALYAAKEHGKDQVRTDGDNLIDLADLRGLAGSGERAARYRAAVRLAEAVDSRDAYGGAHSQRVADLAARVAARLGGDVEQVELARLAGSLHDLGKLAIPEEILRKPTPLTAPERRILERHPQTGFRMLASLGVDRVAATVLHHHERWDGRGYPDGLAGEQIPLAARVLFVADAFDAMTSERVYDGRLSTVDALAELRRAAGTQFDPRVVEALIDELDADAELAAPALAS
jgi:diguanylate cyclase (GGDEF)-like protein/putative nucleotidyltransferase with HDIG domain